MTVSGVVQGVGFRPFVYRMAIINALTGYVRNLGDAGVEILLEGKEESIASFLCQLREQSPPSAKIYDITTTRINGRRQYLTFSICKSSHETRNSGSIVPPDVAICNKCLKELRDRHDPRYQYFFITCTDCGPRFTIIEKLPYDRENTTMRDFPLCDFCHKEYVDPLNRRFHAQTVACPACGPKAYLCTRTGEEINTKDPVREAGIFLSEGSIIAIKGYGGFHIATSALKDTPLVRLRKAKQRNHKPFALMSRDLEATRGFAHVSQTESEWLLSYIRPIVLLDKKDEFPLSRLISPGLHNVGVMLPYGGLHYLLFDKIADPALVLTSANPSNQPMVKDNDEALRKLNCTVDYFLFHNRRIANRCDDSVMRLHDDAQVLMRRSRGYVPAPVMLRRDSKRCVVALGGELNDTSCVLHGSKAFLSQHIGDIENTETREFLEKATMRLIDLSNSKIDAIVCDLHPKYSTTRLAKRLSEQSGWKLFQVQHHFAHAAGLMAEQSLDEILCICCDGYGYGEGGEAWGGELLWCNSETFDFKRVGHLENQPLPGGDMATRYPLRIAAGILSKSLDIEDWLLNNERYFPYGKKEIEVLQRQLETGRGVIETTSCGRVLDAAAALLDICTERTFEGEPAMKLESAATKGRDVLSLEPVLRGNTLDTTQLFVELLEAKNKLSINDLGYSVHAYLAKGLASLAEQKATQIGVKKIGFSGGVAANKILGGIIRQYLDSKGLDFVTHKQVPPGDGGLSFGQAVAVAFSQI
jgi:hydrogenase maturation protein HypF